MKWKNGRRSGSVEDRRKSVTQRQSRENTAAALDNLDRFHDNSRLRDRVREMGSRNSSLRPGRTYTMGRF